MDAAEGTHMRAGRYPMPGAVAGSGASESKRIILDPYNQGGGKSIRLGVRGKHRGLATKIALPVILCLLAALVVSSEALYRQVAALQTANMKKTAANAAEMLSIVGRFLIVHKTQFLTDHPEYTKAVEWPAGEHWLPAHGFVTPDEWTRATGFAAKERASVEGLERTAERIALQDLERWAKTQPAAADIVEAYVIDASAAVVASFQASGMHDQMARLRSLPVNGESMIAGQGRVTVEYLPDFEPTPLVRGTAEIISGGERVGTAVIVFRTSQLIANERMFLVFFAGIGIVILLFMTGVVYWAARRVVNPIRTLSADMQALAGGDYSHRSNLAANPDETGLLALSFNSMAERLRMAMANEKETSRLESDMSTARDIQANLLPLQTPRVRGLDIATSYRPAREIGGDYYDFLPVDSQHIGIVVADASGKSIPAALVMSTTRAILRFVAPANLSAADTLTRVNAILSADIPRGRFVTAYYVILDPLNNGMLCASAGHNPLLIARADGSVELMNPGGIALGFDQGSAFQGSIREERVKLAKGDRVLLYTDGVVECANSANEEYSDRRLREFLRRNRDLSSADFVGELVLDLDRYRGAAEIRDDTTIVTFKVL